MVTPDDTLTPVSSRFSLTAAYTDLPHSDEDPTGSGTRPYVLRVAGAPAPRRRATLPPARYCDVRQVAVTDDDQAAPIHPLGYEQTTVGAKDGNPNPMEDWKPDL